MSLIWCLLTSKNISKIRCLQSDVYTCCWDLSRVPPFMFINTFEPSETWLTGFSELAVPDELPVPAPALISSDLEESSWDKLSSSIVFEENSLEKESSIEPTCLLLYTRGDYIFKYVTFRWVDVNLLVMMCISYHMRSNTSWSSKFTKEFSSDSFCSMMYEPRLKSRCGFLHQHRFAKVTSWSVCSCCREMGCS